MPFPLSVFGQKSSLRQVWCKRNCNMRKAICMSCVCLSCGAESLFMKVPSDENLCKLRFFVRFCKKNSHLLYSLMVCVVCGATFQLLFSLLDKTKNKTSVFKNKSFILETKTSVFENKTFIYSFRQMEIHFFGIRDFPVG